MYVMHVMSIGHVKVYGKLIYLNVYIMVLIHTLNVNTRIPGTFGNTLVTTLMCNYLQSHEHLIVTIIHGLLTDIPSSCKKPNIDVHFCSRLLIHPVI